MSFPASEMRETVTLSRYLGETATGPVYESGIDARCYAEPGFRRVVNASGVEVVASLLLIMPATTQIGALDMVEYASRIYEVIDVQSLHLNGTAHHLEVYLQGKS